MSICDCERGVPFLVSNHYIQREKTSKIKGSGVIISSMTRGTLKLDTNNRGYSEKKFKGLINCNVRNIVKVVTSLLAKLMVVQIFKNHLSYLTGWIVFETLFKKRANENG